MSLTWWTYLVVLVLGNHYTGQETCPASQARQSQEALLPAFCRFSSAASSAAVTSSHSAKRSSFEGFFLCPEDLRDGDLGSTRVMAMPNLQAYVFQDSSLLPDLWQVMGSMLRSCIPAIDFETTPPATLQWMGRSQLGQIATIAITEATKEAVQER